MTFLIYMTIICWLSLFLAGIYTCIKGWQIDFYLKRNKIERWDELSSNNYTLWNNRKPFTSNVIRGGASFVDLSKAIKYINNDLDNEDPQILRLKKSARNGIRYINYSFIAFIVILAVMAALTFL